MYVIYHMYGRVVNGILPLAPWKRKLYNRLAFLELLSESIRNGRLFDRAMLQ